MTRKLLGLTVLAAFATAASALAASPSCMPCAGIAVEDPSEVTPLLGPLGPDQVPSLYVRWTAALDRAEQEAAAARELEAAGAVPWMAVAFTTPPPLLENLESLETELEQLAAMATGAGPAAHFQLDWSSESRNDVAEYAFLIKRAAVAVSGAQPDAQIHVAVPSADGAYLRDLFAQEIAAYLDGVVLAPLSMGSLAGAAASLRGLDPGAAVVVDALPEPERPEDVLAEVSRLAAAGATVGLVRVERPDRAALAPFERIASEFQGDLSLDSYSVPSGVAEAWSFVRGEDLSLRVVIVPAAGADSVQLEFPDPGLHNPARIDVATGDASSLYGLRTGSGFEVEVEAPGRVLLMSLDRMTAAELEGIEGLEDTVEVADTRQMPVEEILQRLQAFEDAQSRRLRHYQAVNTSHLRFQAGTGAGSVEITFRGDYFVGEDRSFDWAWREFFVNGVRWRSKSIPEIPLIQPERASTLPVDINFTPEYRYRLRGTATVAGRDCWVVDFEPGVAAAEGSNLFQGTLWVDREIFARVRTRAVQVGLSGDVLSNQETTTYAPLDANGEAAAWTGASYFLPVRLVGQQIWSILSNSTIVERELLLSDVRINADDFAERRQAVLDSELTIVSDTEQGLRYLIVDEETGERVIEEKLDNNRRFLVGGVLQDESNDFPIPLAGMNWLWFDWRGTGAQANIFFAGPLVSIAMTDPDFRGSRFDVGFDAFALAIAGTDTLFRDGVEVNDEDVEVLSPSIDFKIGRPFGSFFKVDLEYEIEWRKFSRADDTVDDFVIPSDHFNHGLTLTARYNRRGYRFRLSGNYNLRSEWEPWGLPENEDFDPESDTYLLWGASLGKTWHFPKFMKFGLELEYLDGSRLDRFSKYEFGIFSDVTVRGYQSDKVRAEEVLATHLSYGFDIGQLFRLDLLGDVAWATDEVSGFDRELLAGAGVAGTIVGPWRTILNLDVGVAVAGPDSGVTAFLTVLKLFKR
jgi:hypothetical protein